jgi:hypothetical protein
MTFILYPCTGQGGSASAGVFAPRGTGRRRRVLSCARNIVRQTVAVQSFLAPPATVCAVGFVRRVLGSIVDLPGSLVGSVGSFVDSAGSFAGYRAEKRRFMRHKECLWRT